ncbi:MAG TPA: type II toxin-antitoxin system RelE/ParE family toxin [Dehalococcoidia bacterium]|nr:type II toxin-antitoxin system RelE/ParE family toxin [Dehalococcoidia bacterium]
MYNIVLSRNASRTLEKATPTARRRIIAALERLRSEPYSGKTLRGELEGLFSLRIGGMRAVYGVDTKKNIVVILAIGPRGDIYKK